MPIDPTSMEPPVVRCSSCGAWIYWLKNVRTGKLGPVNASPDAQIGNCSIDVHKGDYGAFGPREAAEKRAAGEQLHTSHFVTCPQRASWKKRGSVR